MLVLACTVFLLFVMPGMLYGVGRMIEANTDGRRRAAATRDTGSGSSKQLTANGPGSGDREQTPWFRRPMQPVFTKPKLFD